MVGNLSRFETLPDALKPFKILLLLLLLVLMIASYYPAGWWIWLTLILQLIAAPLLTFFLYADIDKLFITNQWLLFEIFYSITLVIVNLLDTIISITKLIRLSSALFGVAAILFFGLVMMDGMNGTAMYNTWKLKDGSSGTRGPNVQPGDPGAMSRGTSDAPTSGVFPDSSSPSAPTSN